jgi:hypothetical protein
MAAVRPGRLVIALLGAGACADPRAAPPELTLWAWQRPEDVRFAGADVPVAYLAATARIDGRGFESVGRRQPLRTAAGAASWPVVRVEVTRRTTADDLTVHRRALAAVIDTVARADRRVQIDFDARRSERAFYRDLLRDVRRTVPRGTFLSITALASWCLDDRWLDGIDVDEAVPMLFRMGPGTHEVRALLGSGRDFSAPICRGSYGLSSDELSSDLPLRRGRRVYLFHPRPWSEDAYRAARRRLQELLS